MHQLIIYTAKYAIIIPIIAYLTLVYLRRRQLRELLVFTVITAIITAVIVKIATTVHTDPRPFVHPGVHPYFQSSNDNGFPSDHTAASSMVAFIIFRYKRWLGSLILLVAIAIGAARVISKIHHAQDIIGGLLIAGLSTYLAYLLSRYIQRRLGSKQLPTNHE